MKILDKNSEYQIKILEIERLSLPIEGILMPYWANVLLSRVALSEYMRSVEVTLKISSTAKYITLKMSCFICFVKMLRLICVLIYSPF